MAAVGAIAANDIQQWLNGVGDKQKRREIQTGLGRQHEALRRRLQHPGWDLNSTPLCKDGGDGIAAVASKIDAQILATQRVKGVSHDNFHDRGTVGEACSPRTAT